LIAKVGGRRSDHEALPSQTSCLWMVTITMNVIVLRKKGGNETEYTEKEVVNFFWLCS
jgi:hypothetical protein